MSVNLIRRIIAIEGLFVGVVPFGGAGCINPLRSDYTRQLVGSRFHIGRIVAMYAVALPLTRGPAVAMLSGILFA